MYGFSQLFMDKNVCFLPGNLELCPPEYEERGVGECEEPVDGWRGVQGRHPGPAGQGHSRQGGQGELPPAGTGQQASLGSGPDPDPTWI